VNANEHIHTVAMLTVSKLFENHIRSFKKLDIISLKDALCSIFSFVYYFY